MQQILDEPKNLIVELIPKFKSYSDVATITHLQQKLKEVSLSRKKILDASQHNVSGTLYFFLKGV